MAKILSQPMVLRCMENISVRASAHVRVYVDFIFGSLLLFFFFLWALRIGMEKEDPELVWDIPAVLPLRTVWDTMSYEYGCTE